MSRPDPFDGATYYVYDGGNEERLSITDPEEAIEAMFEHAGCSAELLAEIEDESPVLVRAYLREVVPPDWATSEGRGLARDAIESWAEDFGDPDDSIDVDEKELGAELAMVVRKHFADLQVWRCEEVATREYSAAEVERILRANCPDWFKEPTS